MPWYLVYPDKIFGLFVTMLQKTPAQGAWNTVYVATSDDRGESGAYWVNRQPQGLLPCATDEAAAEGLWKLSAQLVDLPEDLEQ